MTRERDTFEMFDPPQRGRFGDNEQRPDDALRATRVTGASDLVDLDMIHHTDAAKPKAIKVSYGDIRQAVWLARSLIKVEETGALTRIYAGRYDQKVRVTLPQWLALEKGLI
jgi:hypothetical protein